MGLLFTAYACQRDKGQDQITRGIFTHDGMDRMYLYYTPRKLPKESPLVVVLHGFTGTAEKIMKYSDMNATADEHGFAVVYPQGTTDADQNTYWNVGYDFHKDVSTDDVDFIVRLVRYLQEKYSLSSGNTFLTGMSNGGEMCYLLACKHPEVFKAIAPVAGVMLQSFFSTCNTGNPIPVFAVFGTKDEVSNYDGDMNNSDGWGAYQSIPFTINYWAEAMNYTSVQTDTLADIDKEDGSFVVSLKYSNEQNENQVLFYKVINGGHDWPGASGNMDIKTNEEIWAFFKKFRD